MSDCHCPLKIAAQEAPASLAFISRDLTLSFKELDRLADGFTFHQNSLIATHHLPTHELIALFFAAWRCNASICPLNTKLPALNIQSCLHRLQPDLFITSFPFKPLTTNPHKKPFSQSLLLFTSGSTGTPKIAVLSLKSLIANATHSIPIVSTDRYLLSLPLYHVGGIGIMLRCVLAKAAIVVDKNHPDITHISCVPTQLYRESPAYKNLKCVLLGGAPITSVPATLPIYGTYGLTEMGSMVLARKNPPQIDGHIYLGKALPGREIRLKPDGEICVRGETLFDGYLNDKKIDDWFETGDIGKQHPTDGIAIIGRKDWQFICGGENIQPEEIEQHLLQIPEVLEAVVVPKGDPEFGMRPVAMIRAQNSLFTLERMQRILAKSLPKYKIPIALYLVDDIPKNGLKIDRRQIINKITNNHFE